MHRLHLKDIIEEEKVLQTRKTELKMDLQRIQVWHGKDAILNTGWCFNNQKNDTNNKPREWFG